VPGGDRDGALGVGRRLDSHYGPVDEVTETLDRSAEEINVWVDETRRARYPGPVSLT
jgi:hypothetical protein